MHNTRAQDIEERLKRKLLDFRPLRPDECAASRLALADLISKMLRQVTFLFARVPDNARPHLNRAPASESALLSAVLRAAVLEMPLSRRISGGV